MYVTDNPPEMNNPGAKEAEESVRCTSRKIRLNSKVANANPTPWKMKAVSESAVAGMT